MRSNEKSAELDEFGNSILDSTRIDRPILFL